jgi:hypothetical protein
MSEYLIRFVQLHPSFRMAEIEAIATVLGLSGQDFTFLNYSADVRAQAYCCERQKSAHATDSPPLPSLCCRLIQSRKS